MYPPLLPNLQFALHAIAPAFLQANSLHCIPPKSSCQHTLTTSLLCLLTAFHTVPYVPSPSCLTTLYLQAVHSSIAG